MLSYCKEKNKILIVALLPLFLQLWVSYLSFADATDRPWVKALPQPVFQFIVHDQQVGNVTLEGFSDSLRIALLNLGHAYENLRTLYNQHIDDRQAALIHWRLGSEERETFAKFKEQKQEIKDKYFPELISKLNQEQTILLQAKLKTWFLPGGIGNADVTINDLLHVLDKLLQARLYALEQKYSNVGLAVAIDEMENRLAAIQHTPGYVQEQVEAFMDEAKIYVDTHPARVAFEQGIQFDVSYYEANREALETWIGDYLKSNITDASLFERLQQMQAALLLLPKKIELPDLPKPKANRMVWFDRGMQVIGVLLLMLAFQWPYP